jgi:hypothetical protein
MALRRFYMIENTNGAIRSSRRLPVATETDRRARICSSETPQEGNARAQDGHPAHTDRDSVPVKRRHDAERLRAAGLERRHSS